MSVRWLAALGAAWVLCGCDGMSGSQDDTPEGADAGDAHVGIDVWVDDALAHDAVMVVDAVNDAEVVNDAEDPGDALRLNHIQVRGTVNSYHDFDPAADPSIHYAHLPFEQQAELQGIRQFDIDVLGDGHRLIVRRTLDWYDREVICNLFSECLAGLVLYSNRFYNHAPLVLLIGETELTNPAFPFFWHVDEIEAYVIHAFGRNRILAPADVRGGHPDLLTAIEADGWPSLDETRGKVMVVLNEHGAAREEYLTFGGLDPDDRILFLIGDLDEPSRDEVIVSFDEPGEDDLQQIEQLARGGFLVHASTDDPEMMQRLRAAGAHMVATRFPAEMFGPAGDHPSSCNPVTAPATCHPEQIDRPLPR
ncbi:MAG: Ca2+-dependent phosphoinositide-specific phospholipase C [bacterium]